MKYNADLKTIGGRLAYLFNEGKYNLDDNGLYIPIRDMYKGKILEYTEVPKDKNEAKKHYEQRIKDQHNKDIQNSYNQVTLHLKNKREPSTKWVIRYAKFFNCSADFILGIHDNKFLDSGLNDVSIKNLRTINKNMLTDSEKNTLNNLLSTNKGLSFRFILRCIDNFINADCHIPIYHKYTEISEDKKVKRTSGFIPDHPQDVITDSAGNKKYILNLLDENLIDDDIHKIQIDIDESFIEDISLKNLDKQIINFKNQVKKQRTN